eukprot:TRINITY_DN4356_c0_g2_i2.p1 TRINITY_DN4356_c0_g2~~TRINITY_DN4356_c0_g2_i2.p1  ORF type:complete len:957 (-),score=233.64 TRINITY_DN4356_c0_g2_i2:284-3154(-)
MAGALRPVRRDMACRRQELDALAELLAGQGEGSALRGWRRELDPEGMLEVDFHTWIEAAARLKFDGDAYALFGIDGDFASLTLFEALPQESEPVHQFLRWVSKAFGGAQQLFAALDEAGTQRLGFDAFASGCRARACPLSNSGLEAVWELSDPFDVGFLKPDDVVHLELDHEVRRKEIYRAMVAQMRKWKQLAANDYFEQVAQQKLSVSKASCASKKSRLEPRPWQAHTFAAMPLVVCHLREVRRRAEMKREMEARDTFRRHIKKTYGNAVRAMRIALDPNQTNALTLRTLRCYCRKQDLPLNAADLFAALDADRDGFVRLEDICVKSALALASLKAFCRGEPCLGSCASIWGSPEAIQASREATGTWFADKKLQTKTFARALRLLGWEEPKVTGVILKSLDLHGCGVISQDDLEWLDGWRPVEWATAAPDPGAWDALRELLLGIYGHPLRAWRVLLDRDDSNTLSWFEFKKACQKIGFDRIGEAWRALDKDLSGTITMREYDPDSAHMLRSFKEWAELNYGSVKHCLKVLDSDRDGHITFSELNRACQKLHWTGDARLLFDCLDTDRRRTVFGVDKNGATLNAQRTLSSSEVAFLDTFHFSLTYEELRLELEAARPDFPRLAPLEELAASSNRLAYPFAHLADDVSCTSATATAPTLLVSEANTAPDNGQEDLRCQLSSEALRRLSNASNASLGGRLLRPSSGGSGLHRPVSSSTARPMSEATSRAEEVSVAPNEDEAVIEDVLKQVMHEVLWELEENPGPPRKSTGFAGPDALPTAAADSAGMNAGSNAGFGKWPSGAPSGLAAPSTTAAGSTGMNAGSSIVGFGKRQSGVASTVGFLSSIAVPSNKASGAQPVMQRKARWTSAAAAIMEQPWAAARRKLAPIAAQRKAEALKRCGSVEFPPAEKKGRATRLFSSKSEAWSSSRSTPLMVPSRAPARSRCDSAMTVLTLPALDG